MNLIQEGEKHFKNLRQLTFSGENAEAYFNLDGTKLIYQAHDGDSLCDQIYIMDIKTGIPRWFQQEMEQQHVAFLNTQKQRIFIYASTHLGSKSCPEKPDYSRGYVWKLYPDFDIFRQAQTGKRLSG